VVDKSKINATSFRKIIILKYGETREKAIAKAKALLLRVSRIAKKTGLTPEDL